MAPGGLGGVWARENTREAVWDAMERRETYCTTGTRPVVRVFGGCQGCQPLVDDAIREPQRGDRQ
jgi:uncharacterized protein DUF3604